MTQGTQRSMMHFSPHVPRDYATCDLHRLVCPHCGQRLHKGAVRFNHHGGLVRCQNKAIGLEHESCGLDHATGDCGVELYILPLEGTGNAFVKITTEAQISRLDRFLRDEGREITIRDIFVALGMHLVPAAPMRVDPR